MALSARHRLLFAFAAIHAALFAYDLRHPERFLFTDRAGERIDTMRAFLDVFQSGGDVPGFLASHGVPGDWLPHALLYLAGGQFLIIAVQIALVLLSISAVHRLGKAARLGERAAIAAAAVYGLLPHTLAFPHQLATEAIFVPLLVIGFSIPIGPGAGIALGAATLVRPVTLLWLPLHPFFEKVAGRWRVLFLVAALGPVLAWMGFIYVSTGESPIGRSTGQAASTVRQYVTFVAQHPQAAANHAARDMMALAGKPGIERLVLDYFDLFPDMRTAQQESRESSRAQAEKHGLRGALAEIWREREALRVVSATAAVLFSAFLALAVIGAFTSNRLRLMLALFVLYVFFAALASGAAHAQDHAPAEFALCVLAVAGWLRLRAAFATRTPARAPVAPRPAIP